MEDKVLEASSNKRMLRIQEIDEQYEEIGQPRVVTSETTYEIYLE